MEKVTGTDGIRIRDTDMRRSKDRKTTSDRLKGEANVLRCFGRRYPGVVRLEARPCCPRPELHDFGFSSGMGFFGGGH